MSNDSAATEATDLDFFVMLTTQSGGMTPMMNDEELAVYATGEEADEAAQNNILGKAFGYEIFERGTGV